MDYPLARFHRSEELLVRWIEMEAFAGVMFRTHLGSMISDEDAQVWSNDGIIGQFAKFSKVFVMLKEYRGAMMREAEEFGWPVVRSLFMMCPDDDGAWEESVLTNQWFFGSSFLVAPVMTENANSVSVYFPTGDSALWISLWTGDKYGPGSTATVASEIGFPPVFYREGGEWGERLREDIGGL